MGRDGGPVHGEALGGVAPGAELLEHVILAGMLRAPQRSEPDQRLRVGDLIGETLRHGGFDLGGEGGVEGHGNSEPVAAGRKRPGSGPLSTGGCSPQGPCRRGVPSLREGRPDLLGEPREGRARLAVAAMDQQGLGASVPVR